MTVFDKIKKLADKKGVSVSKVAIDLGFSENLFYQWKTSSPKSDRLEKVADYFHVSTDYLLGRTNNLTATPTLSAKQMMMRMDTDDLSKDDLEDLEKEMERFLRWRIEEIKRERDSED